MFRANTWRDLLIHLGIILALFFLLILGFFYFYLPWSTHHGEYITVPDVKETQLDNGINVLETSGLRYQISDSVFDPTKPNYTVVQQNPTAGNQVKQGRKVYLTVTSGTPPIVKMPSLLGRSLMNAQKELTSLGLQTGKLEYKPDMQENAILEQRFQGKEIKPGDEIPKGSKVDLVIGDGLGNQVFAMPDLTGKMLDDARFELAGSSLQVGAIIYQNDPDKELGTIIRQNPSPGRDIRVGEEVDLWVVGYEPEDGEPPLEN
ncbi:PASTA domain, binds beta-lactams [Catalinimonas alkaloidigena]|uniref:PASTA domain, binds beta-lactams n=1 Tax=Catalinimonas alkaloidigena TaxID=1075417 RepID=A0A1G8WUV1_9BACT|nr:PASTA domain-containing protein [Catalinimonas alkaloidigena]SDJ82138.1 PASTA domain, binds beta-lactams [Catalinimonas alkaloidigena]